jgi:hypothetical protein
MVYFITEYKKKENLYRSNWNIIDDFINLISSVTVLNQLEKLENLKVSVKSSRNKITDSKGVTISIFALTVLCLPTYFLDVSIYL